MALDRIQYLLEQQLGRPLTEAEEKELMAYCDNDAETVVAVMAGLIANHTKPPVYISSAASESLFNRILTTDQLTSSFLETSHRRRIIPLFKWVAAAVFILLATGFAYLVYHNKIADSRKPVVSHAADLPPGHDGAILTLGDGRTIVLEGMHEGALIGEHNATIQFENNQLVYTPKSERSNGNAPVKNTLSTPRGRQFQLVLPDGSKVWLNAASTITYPAVFEGTERMVELSGEAYFEVTANAAQPFVVKAQDTKVTVLGTALNVMAYKEEGELLTTLVEGAVRVQRQYQAVTLKPGNQVESGKGFTLHDKADVEAAIAWKNGKFHFDENATIQTVMRQVANWYDVEIVYHGAVTEHIGGTVDRNVSLGQLLKVLEATGVVKFKVEGRRIEVFPA